MTEDQETAAQIAKQCIAIQHMAKVLAGLNKDYHRILRDIEAGSRVSLPLDLVGRRTAQQMEALGNMLNNMDAVTDEDDWLDPIFKEAHKRWPIEPEDVPQ